MITPALLKRLREDEGFSGKPYRCTAGKLTIGYGHNLEAKPISKNVAELLLLEDAEDAEKEVRQLFANFDRLNDVRHGVLICMCFQIGMDGLAKFRNFRKAVEAEDWKMARFHGLDSKWARSDSPARANRLMLILERGEW